MQLHCGISSTFIRQEFSKKDVRWHFEINGSNQKWFQALKTKNNIENHPYLSKSSALKFNSKKVELDIMPLRNCGGDLKKVIKNQVKKKFTLYIKVYKTENNEVHFRLRDAQALGPISNEAETKITQTSLEQFFRKTK